MAGVQVESVNLEKAGSNCVSMLLATVPDKPDEDVAGNAMLLRRNGELLLTSLARLETLTALLLTVQRQG